MPEKKPLGQLLKEKGFVTEAYLRFALLEQKATRERLGEILTRLGLVTEFEVARVLADQAGLPFEDLLTTSPDPKALHKVPPAFAKQREILPLQIREGVLVVAALQEAINGG